MNYCSQIIKSISTQQYNNIQRHANPEDILVPFNYRIEVFVNGLDTPIGIDFTEDGSMLIADSGIVSNNPKVLILYNGQLYQIADGFNTPITGITYSNGNIYVSHKGVITIVRLDGTRRDILKGLPSYGDYSNSKVCIGPDGKIYFGQGTATNSGIVGLDNQWIHEHAYFHDYPGSFIMLNGQSFPTQNAFTHGDEITNTGAFLPYGTPYLQPYYTLQGNVDATGSVLRANIDGSQLELVAWGFRNPATVKFDSNNRLFVANQGFDERGSRPIANAPDELQLIIPMTWYGWPDFAAGEPVTSPQFSRDGRYDLEFLFTSHPSVPPRPFATFQPNVNVMGFDFNENPNFGTIGDIYIAEFGEIGDGIMNATTSPVVGCKIDRVHVDTGERETFASNRSNVRAYINTNGSQSNGGFSRPSDVVFGPDGAMYIVDMAITTENIGEFLPYTGVIWRITR